MKRLITILAALFTVVLEESLVMLGIAHSYRAYNTQTGEYVTVSSFEPHFIGQVIQAPWYSAHAGCQVIVLERSPSYIITT